MKGEIGDVGPDSVNVGPKGINGDEGFMGINGDRGHKVSLDYYTSLSKTWRSDPLITLYDHWVTVRMFS